MHTEINDNTIFAYIYFQRKQYNYSGVFKYTNVIECTEDKKLVEVGTLGSLEKICKLSELSKNSDTNKLDWVYFKRFEKAAGKNNAIYCYNTELKFNRFGQLEDVGAIVYGTRDVKDCALVREYVQ